MKTRCMCGKPDRIMRSGRVNIDFYPKHEVLLHFKVADRCCSHCGRGLCEDCQVLDAWELGHDPFGRAIWKDPEEVKILCPDCADILEGKND